MEAPKCKFCGNTHWSNEAHTWPKQAETVVDKIKAVVDTNKKRVEEAKKIGRYLDAGKRKAYQANWVKKKRSAKKGDK